MRFRLFIVALCLTACGPRFRTPPDCSKATYNLDELGFCVFGQSELTPSQMGKTFTLAIAEYEKARYGGTILDYPQRSWNLSHHFSVSFTTELDDRARAETVCDNPTWEWCNSIWVLIRTNPKDLARTAFYDCGEFVHELFHVGLYRDGTDGDPYHTDPVWRIACQARFYIPEQLGL